MKKIILMILLLGISQLYSADWPKIISGANGTITVYQPQVSDFRQNSLSMSAAISLVQAGQTEPVYGAVWLDCQAATDLSGKLVKLQTVMVKGMKFPEGSDADIASLSSILSIEIPKWRLTFPLDQLQSSIEAGNKEKEAVQGMDNSPPKIIVKSHPAVLVLIDGEPILNQQEGTTLKRVVNTPFFLVQDTSSGEFYLKGGDNWYAASDIMGQWQQTDNPPQAAVDLAGDAAADNQQGEETQTDNSDAQFTKSIEIIVSKEPAELIATEGPIQFSLIAGTGLLYASNTSSKLFLEINGQKYYILISGRWYVSKGLYGPWKFIEPDKLPEDFAKIPPGSDHDDVLANVAGTIPAKEAVQDAQIPQVTEVKRSDTTNNIDYDGNPQFEKISGTSMQYAVNSSSPVIYTGGFYYNCDHGLWFVSASASGPWVLCVNVPSDIYNIPPQCPVYYVRYVYVYSYDDDFAYVGYTPGYTGCYIYHGTVVYGTGYHYRYWYRNYYYPRPWTWGFSFHYNPWSGWSFGTSQRWWKPAGWISHPRENYHSGWWGPVGYRPANPPLSGPVYRPGYHPANRPVETVRTFGNSPGIYGHWKNHSKPVEQVNPTRQVKETYRNEKRTDMVGEHKRRQPAVIDQANHSQSAVPNANNHHRERQGTQEKARSFGPIHQVPEEHNMQERHRAEVNVVEQEKKKQNQNQQEHENKGNERERKMR